MTDDSETGWVVTLELSPPSLANNTGDLQRLLAALQKRVNAPVEMDLGLVRRLPGMLREGHFRIGCTLFRTRSRWVVTGLFAADDPQPLTGLAVDLGTSRVVIRLVDLVRGTILGEAAFDNPQIAVGPDILARIHFADAGGLDSLHQMIISELNARILVLCHDTGTDSRRLMALSVAGNTAMTHLFLGIDPRWIIREPYIPAVNRPDPVPARLLGIEANENAQVLVFPNVASYFGGDLIAGILYSKIYRRPEISILVDVGTNAEVVLGNDSWLMACAGAAGPALEGGVTRMGMMAGPGVIDRVLIDPETRSFSIHTIQETRPKGICGSGLIDLAAQLFLAGMIDIRGRWVPSACGRRLVSIDGVAHLVVVPARDSATGADLTLSQVDLDSLIRSKAAMFTILETLTGAVGLSLEQLSIFNVAGTFGSFINPASAIAIGMLPDLPLSAYRSLGNSSLEGATLALTTTDAIEQIDAICDRITYMELNVNQEFMNRFSAAKFLPHTDPSRFASVKFPRP
jgi:uncharacterized 2Fe-2S/4Fe-4S cluster protein (DUF4445 family)